jgi:hypothetical protein
MKAEIKLFEYNTTMENYFTPENPSKFCELVMIKIGPQSFDGGDYFHFHIVTPEWLTYAFEFEGKFTVEWGRHQLIVPYWNQEKIESQVHAIVYEHGNGEEWGSIAKSLNRFFHWEFEDYREL